MNQTLTSATLIACLATSAHASDHYWVEDIIGWWDDGSNWDFTPGGPVSLDVVWAQGYAPQIGDEFVIAQTTGGVTGTFDSIDVVGGPPVFTFVDGTTLMGIVGIAPCPADINGDGDIGFPDLLSVLSAWGVCGGCAQDVDGDGTVGFSDVLAVLSAWGAC